MFWRGLGEGWCLPGTVVAHMHTVVYQWREKFACLQSIHIEINRGHPPAPPKPDILYTNPSIYYMLNTKKYFRIRSNVLAIKCQQASYSLQKTVWKVTLQALGALDSDRPGRLERTGLRSVWLRACRQLLLLPLWRVQCERHCFHLHLIRNLKTSATLKHLKDISSKTV